MIDAEAASARRKQPTPMVVPDVGDVQAKLDEAKRAAVEAARAAQAEKAKQTAAAIMASAASNQVHNFQFTGSWFNVIG